jgi:hypothetical protein
MLWLLTFLAITAAMMYGAARLILSLSRTALGIEQDPAERARKIAARMQGHLTDSTAGALYAPMLEQIGEVVKTRLPRLVETRDRLADYLHRRHPKVLQREVESLKAELARTGDPKLRELVERNLQLALEGLDTHEQMQLVHDRTCAQIRNVVLTLETLEDRVVTANVAALSGDVAPQLDAMVADVEALEAEFRKLKLLT